MKIWASLLLAMFPLQVTAKELLVLKYEDLPQLVANSSKDVKSADLLAQAAATRRGFAERARYPRIELSSGLRGVRDLDGSSDHAPFLKAEGSINLYRGGRDALRDKIQEQESAIRKEESQLVLKSQLTAARELYIRLASVRDLQRIWTGAMQTSELNKKASRIRVNAGLTTSTDVLEFDLHQSALKREKRVLEKEELELSHRLRILLGLNEGTVISLGTVYPHPPESKGQSPEVAPALHPSVRKLSLQADQAETMSRTRASRWLPEVNLFASYEEYLKEELDQPGTLPRRDFAAGIRVSLPLGDNLTMENEAVAKSLEAAAYQLQKQQSEQQLKQRYEQFQHDKDVLHALLHDAEEQVQKARQYLKQTKAEYERGVKNAPDVLAASQTLYSTETESIQLRYEYYLAEAGLAEITAPASSF